MNWNKLMWWFTFAGTVLAFAWCGLLLLGALWGLIHWMLFSPDGPAVLLIVGVWVFSVAASYVVSEHLKKWGML